MDQDARMLSESTMYGYARCISVFLLVALVSLLRGETLRGQSAPGGDFLFKIGAAYDEGDFGTLETSRVLFVPVTLRYVSSRFDISATPSFALVNTTGGVRLVEGVPTPTGENPTEIRETASGIGDTVIRGRVYLVDDYGADSPVPAVTPFFKVKIPTARDDLNLGTGETDYGFGLEIDKQIPPVLVFGDVSYTVIGKTPSLPLRNRPAASFGLGFRISEAVLASGLLDWRRSIIQGNENPTEVVGVVSFRLSPVVTFSPHAFVGLTDSSPDFGAGFELAFRFALF
jgi:hypothetical protein